LVDSLTGLLVNLEAKPEPRFGRGNSTTGLIYTSKQEEEGPMMRCFNSTTGLIYTYYTPL